MKITFVFADIWETEMRLKHENEFVPYKKRTVSINLTEEQLKQIQCQRVGRDGNEDKYEEIIDCFIENEESVQNRLTYQSKTK